LHRIRRDVWSINMFSASQHHHHRHHRHHQLSSSSPPPSSGLADRKRLRSIEREHQSVLDAYLYTRHCFLVSPSCVFFFPFFLFRGRWHKRGPQRSSRVIKLLDQVAWTLIKNQWSKFNHYNHPTICSRK
jgi:hypothetical protein